MRKIHHVILSEIAPPSIIALVVLTFVVFTREFGRLAELLIRKNADALTVSTVVLALLPGILVFTIPFSFLIGTLIGIGRLSADSEIVAMRASGLSIYQLLSPVWKAGVGVTVLTLILTFFFLPEGNSALRRVRHQIGLRPVQSEVKPRVFNEDLPGMILYVEDIDLQSSTWKGAFLADTAGPEKRIILANLAYPLFSSDAQRLQLHFENGLIYKVGSEAPEKDTLTRFQTLDIPIDFPAAQPAEAPKKPPDKNLSELLADLEGEDEKNGRTTLIELQRRLALPLSALIFSVLGVTLGIHTPRGGRGYGFILSVIIAFTYYVLFASGIELAEMGELSLLWGVWGADILLGLVALASLYFTESSFGIIHSFTARIPDNVQRLTGKVLSLWRRIQRKFGGWSSGPRIRLQVARVIDLYILRTFAIYFFLALSICVSLFYLFTFFELIDDIFAHDVSQPLVWEYFFYLLPHILMLLVPISILIATVVAFGLLDRTNQMIALKSCGVSVYRATLPVFALVLALSFFVFVLQEYVLPYANQRQDSLRNVIKGRPVQTHYQLGHNWIFGEDNRLYNYSYFDSEHDAFAELTVYRLDIGRSQLFEHLSARRAVWDRKAGSWRFYNGWRRAFQGDQVEFSPFEERMASMGEGPDYFEKEVKESSKMTYTELKEYIRSLQQGGFEVDHLKTELYKKVSFPLVNLLMALLGVPFAFTLGRKGAFYGVAAGILIGIGYWGAFGLFAILGSNGLLSPLLAAWGPNVLAGAGGALLLAEVRT